MRKGHEGHVSNRFRFISWFGLLLVAILLPCTLALSQFTREQIAKEAGEALGREIEVVERICKLHPPGVWPHELEGLDSLKIIEFFEVVHDSKVVYKSKSWSDTESLNKIEPDWPDWKVMYTLMHSFAPLPHRLQWSIHSFTITDHECRIIVARDPASAMQSTEALNMVLSIGVPTIGLLILAATWFLFGRYTTVDGAISLRSRANRLLNVL